MTSLLPRSASCLGPPTRPRGGPTNCVSSCLHLIPVRLRLAVALGQRIDATIGEIAQELIGLLPFLERLLEQLQASVCPMMRAYSHTAPYAAIS